LAFDRVGQQPLISEDRLAEHLAALHKQGYVTITQKDIKDFYEAANLCLPEPYSLCLKTGVVIRQFFPPHKSKVQL
jgi:hypothetical protein